MQEDIRKLKVHKPISYARSESSPRNLDELQLTEVRSQVVKLMEEMEALKRSDIGGNLNYLRVRVDHNKNFDKPIQQPQSVKTPPSTEKLATKETLKNYDDALNNLQAQLHSTTNDISDVRDIHKTIFKQIDPLTTKWGELNAKVTAKEDQLKTL
jgi:hypothetical protein